MILFREHEYGLKHLDMELAISAIVDAQHADTEKCEYKIRGSVGNWQVYRAHPVMRNAKDYVLEEEAAKLSKTDSVGVVYFIRLE